MDDGGGEVDHRFEAGVCFVAAHCDALEFLQLAEEILWRSPFRRSMHKRGQPYRPVLAESGGDRVEIADWKRS